MLGAIAGDICGSLYECSPVGNNYYWLFAPGSRFTDDTVLTVAEASALVGDGDYARSIQQFAESNPKRGYGAMFSQWVRQWHPQPYDSFGNGSAMRVSPVGFAFDSVEEVLREAKRSAEVTHSHPEGIKGAQAVALSILMARQGADKREIRGEVSGRFGYDLSRSLDDIRPTYSYDVTCQGSVPEAIIAFLEAESVGWAIRNAISLGGDADTQACIAGGIAQAAFGLPKSLNHKARHHLPSLFLEVIDVFVKRYMSCADTKEGLPFERGRTTGSSASLLALSL